MSSNVVVLLGRLGNQLFQYAFAQWLELNTGLPTRFDLSYVGRDGVTGPPGLREQIHERRVRGSAVLPALGGRLGPVARMVRTPRGPRRFVIDWAADGSPPSPIGAPAWWVGYWQRPEFLEGSRDHLREVFGLNGIDAQPVIRVHVRRGDYVRLGIAPHADWYGQAIERAVHAVPHERVEVISDDPAWCRTHLTLPVPYDLPAKRSPVEDFQALASSAALVATGSTFSWWAAYLGGVPVIHEDGVIPASLWSLISTV